MKIEKLNDNQIRCTLNPQDLKERQLKLSELAYGSDKAKELFQDMMQEAFQEYGFEAENTPLMIEAIPTSPESIILVVTKVDNPEELDTRFSTFTPYQGSDEEEKENNPFPDEMMEQLNQIHKTLLGKIFDRQAANAPAVTETDEAGTEHADEISSRTSGSCLRAFRFRCLSDLTEYAKTVRRIYHGECVLYKHPTDSSYILCVTPDGVGAAAFNRTCNLACEYATMQEQVPLAFYREHYQKVFEGDDGIRRLARL